MIASEDTSRYVMAYRSHIGWFSSGEDGPHAAKSRVVGLQTESLRPERKQVGTTGTHRTYNLIE